ncbi:MAG: hypothetical protein E6Q24_05095 [Chitinophagaceae bacterium]|nr:MAG: hypothetical protein E6Q24_05095 [Chitinophagaceae bacterium]
MLYALSKEGARISATPGIEGYCEGCNALLIPRCGDINTWHWAHESCSCDSWNYEPKTYWHEQWQRRFHVDDTEVGIKKNGEFHRADIVGNNDVVIEVQHSPLAESEIIKRERFYGNMIWVLNARTFAHNLSLVHERDDVFHNSLSLYMEDEKFSGSLTRIKLTVPSGDDGAIENALKANQPLCRQCSELEDCWYWESSAYYNGKELPTDIKAAYYAFILHDCLYAKLEDENKNYPIDIKWKHRRKSWSAAKMPIFLDIGSQLLIWLGKNHFGNFFDAKVVTKDRFSRKYRKRLPTL